MFLHRSVLARACLFIVGVTSAPQLAAAKKPDVAVMPLTARRVPKGVVEILDELLTAELDASGKFQVLGVRDIEAMLGFEKMKEVLGCDSISCAVEIGGALGVNLILSGSVGRLGDKIFVQLTLIDSIESKVVRRGRGEVQNDENLYPDALSMAVAEIAGIPRKTKVVTITGRTPPPTKPRVRAANISPVRYQFTTPEPTVEFNLQYMTSDGMVHRCDKPLTVNTPCLLVDMALGDGSLSVTAVGLGAFTRALEVDEDDELLNFKVVDRPSAGSVLMWTFGGLGMATGAALIGVGIGLDSRGFIYGGVPSLLIGTGLLVVGFFFDGRVHVTYPTWGLLF